LFSKDLNEDKDLVELKEEKEKCIFPSQPSFQMLESFNPNWIKQRRKHVKRFGSKTGLSNFVSDERFK
jgi:hypothetical protein